MDHISKIRVGTIEGPAFILLMFDNFDHFDNLMFGSKPCSFATRDHISMLEVWEPFWMWGFILEVGESFLDVGESRWMSGVVLDMGESCWTWGNHSGSELLCVRLCNKTTDVVCALVERIA